MNAPTPTEIANEVLEFRRADARIARWVAGMLGPVAELAGKLGLEIHLTVRARHGKIAVQVVPPPHTE